MCSKEEQGAALHEEEAFLCPDGWEEGWMCIWDRAM